MAFLKPDLLRSFGIGFLLGCAVLAMTMNDGSGAGGLVPAAVAAPAQ